MIFSCSESFQKISKKTFLVEPLNIKDRYCEQSVCKLTERRTPPRVFYGEIFESEWLWTSEQSEIDAFVVIRFLPIKISFDILF